MEKKYLIFDIGGTHTRIALTDGKKIVDLSVVNTPNRFQQGLSVFEQYADKYLQTGKISGIVGGIRGSVDKVKGSTNDRFILSDWAGKPFAGELKRRFKVPVLLENDANLAGLGEAVYGAGKGVSVMAYFTISSGVGGTRIVDQKIDQEVSFGFEPGKQIIDIDGYKTFEDFVSGFAIEKKYGKKPKEIKNKKIWNNISKILAVGIFNSVLHWSPKRVVIGGAIVDSIYISETKKHLKYLVKNKFSPPQLIKAKLGDRSGLYGAMTMLKNSSLKK